MATDIVLSDASADASFNRKPELDGLRGAAILMVLALHFLSYDLAQTGTSWAVALGKSMRLFWSGVDLFFVLSGFLIGGILLKNRNAPNFFKVFFIRRACRILPLYVLVLLAFIIVAPYGPDYQNPVPLWSYWFFVQNFLMAIQHDWGPPLLSPTWSLAVEEQFYLLLPLMVRFLPKRPLVTSAVVGCLTSVVLRMFYAGEMSTSIISFFRLDSVFAGLLLAMAMRAPISKSFLNEHRGILGWIVLFLGLGMIILTLKPDCLGEGIHLWIAGFYAGIIALVSLGWPTWLYRLFAARWLQFVGIVSYGLYLLHMPIHWLGRQLIQFPVSSVSGVFVIAALATLLTIAAATLTYFSFERWFVRLGHRFVYKESNPK